MVGHEVPVFNNVDVEHNDEHWRFVHYASSPDTGNVVELTFHFDTSEVTVVIVSLLKALVDHVVVNYSDGSGDWASILDAASSKIPTKVKDYVAEQRGL